MEVTKFQQQVYNLVRTIPEGKTMTYKEVAIAIGRPRAYRAVGNALNKNPRPTFSSKNLGGQAFVPVPCHRVVKSDGSVGGFAWGSNKKLQLLQREGATL